MRRVRIPAFLDLSIVAFAACVSDPCHRGICGCWKNYTFRAIIEITDSDGRPSPGMTLSCESTQELFGVTKQDGKAAIRIKSQTSPGCGGTAVCEQATLRNSAGKPVASVNMTLLLRGHEICAGGYGLSIDSNSLR